MKIKIFIPLVFLIISSSFAQLQISGNFTGKGIVYSGEDSPFWIHNNQRGRVNEKTNVSAVLSGLGTYNISENARFSLGLGALYQDGYTDILQLDESFLGFENSWLAIHVGRKQRAELYRGLSASNENILWSLNARPMSGISFRTTRPIYFIKSAGLAFQASLEDFIADDDRYVKDTRVHHKSFHLIFDKIQNFEIKVGLQHFVQWAGTSPEFGKLPGSFNDYLKVSTGSGVSEEVGGGNEINALGNHLGSYVAGIKTVLGKYEVEIIYNSLFEDGSGQKLRNTPDGRYGIFIADMKPGKWIDAFMYEFYYTKHQSTTIIQEDFIDNYFNNSVYRSGWTYESRILGVPFITLDENRYEINNNTIVAHHFGMEGYIYSKIPYKLINSYRKNYGRWGRNNLRSDILSTYLDLNVYQNIFQVNVQLGADFISDASPNFGAGLQLRKTLF
ncbi:MAG: capsule assembly Wzi family protein [Bacteroidota bacterium]